MTDAAVPAQEAHLESSRGAHAAPDPAAPATTAAVTAAAVTARPAETLELKYLRETRNAVTFIAVVIGILATISLIATIIVGVQVAKINNDLNGISGGSSSNCMSQGGTDPSC